jgi:hypothetical protein
MSALSFTVCELTKTVVARNSITSNERFGILMFLNGNIIKRQEENQAFGHLTNIAYKG